jgi:hypothetical protein
MMWRKIFCFAAAVLLFCAGASVLRAQTSPAANSSAQPASLGDAARKVRAQKKPAGKSAKVFTNDDMGRLKDTPSAVAYHSSASAGTGGTQSTRKSVKPSAALRAKKN